MLEGGVPPNLHPSCKGYSPQQIVYEHQEEYLPWGVPCQGDARFDHSSFLKARLVRGRRASR